MLGFVPVGRELVGATHDHRLAFDRECLGRFQPGLECLLGELLAGAVQESGPCFSGRERHSVCGKLCRGEAKLEITKAKCNSRERRLKFGGWSLGAGGWRTHMRIPSSN